MFDAAKQRDRSQYYGDSIPVIYLYGASGVGKTRSANDLFAKRFLQSELGRVPTIDEMAAEVYIKTPFEKYWNNYKSQRVVIFDDFQMKINPNADEYSLTQMLTYLNVKNAANIAVKGSCCRRNYPSHRLLPPRTGRD